VSGPPISPQGGQSSRAQIFQAGMLPFEAGLVSFCVVENFILEYFQIFKI
jgi:hypothetical protein